MVLIGARPVGGVVLIGPGRGRGSDQVFSSSTSELTALLVLSILSVLYPLFPLRLSISSLHERLGALRLIKLLSISRLIKL